jgi:hypothetical protein
MEENTMECQEKSQFCNNKNVKLCQMKSNKGGITRANVYEGKIVAMCGECRKMQNGQFKFVVKP